MAQLSARMWSQSRSAAYSAKRRAATSFHSTPVFMTLRFSIEVTRPERARVAIAVRDGFVGMGRIIYGGTGCYTKARIAADIVRDQLVDRFQVDPADLRFDYIGVNALFDWGVDTDAVREVELRVTGRFPSREAARRVQMLVSQLPVSVPAGAAWGRPMDQGGVEEIVTFQSALIDRSDIPYRINYLAS